MNKKIFSLIFIAVIWFALGTYANAASLSIKTNKTSVSPGESITVTVTLSNGAGKITSGGQTFWLDNSSYSYNVTAGSSGSVSLSASGVLADYSTEQDQSVSASASVKINTPVATPTPVTPTTKPTPVPTNNNGNTNTTTEAPTLSNLGITPHDFSGFSANKTSYTVNVPNDCATVNLYATSKNGTVSGTGNKSLKEGTNKFSVTVTNSSGSKTYTVSIVRLASSGNDVPNIIDDAPEEEEQPIESIGLSSLEVLGYELDKEFKVDEYSYTIKVPDEITRRLLRRIKRKD